jgi:hypothetical protein
VTPVKLTRILSGGEKPFWVNPDRISYFGVVGTNTTVVNFDSDLSIHARETPEEIILAIKWAGLALTDAMSEEVPA